MRMGSSASHVPVLSLLPKLYEIKRVLEFGSGEMSTALFLDKVIYPDLQELVSIEEDPEWMVKTSTMVCGEKRIKLLSSAPAYLYGYDLIFIDGPQSAARRIKTIKYVMWQPNQTLLPCPIVIHDIEYKPYKEQLNKKYYDHAFTFCKSPMTGVYSSKPLSKPVLKRANRVMSKHFAYLQENWGGWKTVWDVVLK
jgi:hypothetical protein